MGGASAQPQSLARQLLEEQDYRAARVEAVRWLSQDPQHPEPRLLLTIARARQNPTLREADALAALTDDPTLPSALRSEAAYEAGRVFHLLRRPETAWQYFRVAFQTAPNRSLFLRAGLALRCLAKDHPELSQRDPALWIALSTLCTAGSSAPKEPRNDENGCGHAPLRSTLTGRCAAALIRFYRSQISPALGARCSLEPSCSEYARQAISRHGLLGLAMFADRTVREPTVVAEKARPIRVSGRWRYVDPLDDHDEWLRGSGEAKETP